MAVILYALDGCPYCDAVDAALDDAGVEYETRTTPALHSERDEVKRHSGQRLVPVLVDEARGVTMCDSSNIINYVERTLSHR